MMLKRQAFSLMALFVSASLSGCDRHSEADARAMAEQWFDTGETIYFESRRSCTVAVFRATTGDVKSRVPLFGSVDALLTNGGQKRDFALVAEDKTADALFIDLMNGDRPTGVAVQEASVAARPCMDEDARGAFYAALTASPSVIVFSPGEGVLAVLDPVRRNIVLTGGEG